jgi:tetratricopeptide (TPR) repeat protein
LASASPSKDFNMTPKRLTLAAALVAAAFVVPAFAHPGDAGKPAAEKLGHVLFKTSCTPEAQKQFERALAMLHSFYFPETVKAFTAIPETDPSCAIAYWGLAVSTRPNPLVGPWDAATLKRGWDAVEKGRAIGAKTQRERDWIEAIGEVYRDFDKVDQDTRTKNYEKAMGELTRKYPNDIEAKIFYALALNESFDHSDKSYANLLKAAKLLEPLDRKYPDHPGITHYIIHSLDFAPLAQRGLPAANKYAKVAPSAPHALHMPSHIYSMIGMWEASIASNLRSVAVANEYTTKNKMDGALAGVPHSYDFMQYAYLQLGQDAKAKALIDDSGAITKVLGAPLVGAMARTAVPARYMLERQDWSGAAQLKPLDTKFPAAEAITYFARAMGAARTGNFAAAQTDIDKLKEQRAAMEKTNQSYWAEQIEVQILGAQAWVAQGQGNKEEALKLMRAAADLEDGSEKHVAMENRLYPMRELLADLLMEQGQPGAALKEYQASMKASPARLRGFYGAAKAAEAAGDTQKAAAYYRSLARLTHNADGDRAELREAKQHVASR